MPTAVRLTSDRLVGREGELAATLAALRGLAEGRPGVVTVAGPAGVGKTRFVAALAERLRAEGVRVLAGGCLDAGAGAPPYAALLGAFRSADPPAVQVLDALTGAVAMRRSRLFDLLRSTVAALARRRPTVLVVEDLHWVDRITRDALLYLVTMAHEGRWALVVTFRDDEVADRPVATGLLGLLHREALAQVSLGPLSPAQVADQAQEITGRRLPEAAAARLHRRSGGIPLLVEELLAYEAAGTGGVPPHLRRLFLARVEGLGPRAARAVQAVAVAGDRCRSALAAQVLDDEPAAVAAALDRALEAGLLAADGPGYRIRHELLREAVYASLPPTVRRALHARAAAALAAGPRPDVAALAHHWHEAGEPERAALASLAAAGLAERVHAPAEVRGYLERVLDNLDRLPPERAAATADRASLLARAAEAAYLSGDFTGAVTLARRALDEPGDPAAVVVRWERLARYCWVSRDGAGAWRAHERSVALLSPDAPADARARVLSGYAWHLAMAERSDQAMVLSEQARAAVEAGSDPLDRCRALLAWGHARGGEEAGLAALRQARDLAVRCDAGEELARAHVALDLALLRHGRTAERERVLRDGLGHVAAHGMDGSYGPAMKYLLAELLIDLGRWDEARQVLDEAVGQGVHGVDGVPAMFVYAYRARLAAGRGDAAAVAADAGRVAELAPDLPQQPVPLAVALTARAEASLWAGDAAAAAAYAAQAGSLSAHAWCRAEAAVLAARAAADLAEADRRHGRTPEAGDEATGSGAPGAAGAYAPGTPPRDRRLPALAATAAAERSRGAGRRDPEPWRVAVAAWQAAGDPYREAYCRWRLAHALLATRSGRRAAAAELRGAYDTGVRLGARPLLEAARSLGTAARIRLGEPADADAAAAETGLTPRELEILPLVAAGRTNAEIAGVLVISPRTVGVHVSRILAKLGAARRTEAADVARRRGLLTG